MGPAVVVRFGQPVEVPGYRLVNHSRTVARLIQLRSPGRIDFEPGELRAWEPFIRWLPDEAVILGERIYINRETHVIELEVIPTGPVKIADYSRAA